MVHVKHPAFAHTLAAVMTSPYVVRYHTPQDGALASIFLMAKSAADAVAQVKGCSPALCIKDVEPHTEDTLQGVAQELQRAGKELHEAAEAMRGTPGLYMASTRATRFGERALVAAGVILGG